MESIRILIAINNNTSIAKLKAILMENGLIVADQVSDGHECLRKMRMLKPDIAIIEYDLDSMNGYEISKLAVEDNICNVILICNDSHKALMSDILSDNRLVCLPKPLNKIALLNSIELLVKSSSRISELEREIEELKSNLDTRKEIEKAKGLLMSHLNLSENEAFKRIQKQSMDRGIPMKDIAKAIILAYDI